MALEFEDFTRGFVAALVDADRTSFQPKNEEQRKALYRVHAMVQNEVGEARKSPTNLDWLKTVVRIRNALAPGQTGAFDQFETALRDLQLSLTESPNPSYEDITFPISRPFAKSVLGRLKPRERALVQKAVGTFLQGANV
ncbi:hypothetical protein NLY43_19030 [Mesorhizobium sp. C416B]|uniref:hypothetical protein n=1 Tax=unclassified Mesorhizobium TaxID=325217 RepID=UPI0003CE5DC8|nr:MULTISPECIES: hypothetical protein [unclassified Mesorhizobium]ESX51337.1 hypothetical protein X762_04800 [Mesorhizobium sp. LSHC426A00]WJI60714.1 hypothetical protein NLY43_19030 [Mesorhizobium sp. C416B]